MAKKKSGSKNKGGESWRSKVKRMENIYGALKIPLWEKYPHLKEVITVNNNSDCFVPKLRNTNAIQGKHPYSREIAAFKLPHGYRETCKEKLSTVPSKMKMTATGMEDYSVEWVTTAVQLTTLINRLSTRDHIFMDLEGHNFRSFRGITSLLQIFDEEYRTVFFVDTLQLHNEMDKFQGIFINPRIIKVMHGSHTDIKSFEKDFSLYIIGLVDTQMVFRVYHQLNRPGHFKEINPANISYKNLVNGLIPDAKLEKSETFTDFRQRPLHPAQQKYAFLDVWYLPYVYFKMASELDDDHLTAVVNLSKEICSEQRFTFPSVDLEKRKDENDILWQLRRLRHYIALKEDVNPEYLSSPSILIHLRGSAKPNVEREFLRYPLALQKALRGEDGVRELETRYSDLSIPFPFTSNPLPRLIFCCKHWTMTDHAASECTLSKAEVKLIKQKHYKENPDKKQNRNRGVHRREKSTAEKRKKRNKRNAESKKRTLPEAFVKRREKWLNQKREWKHHNQAPMNAMRRLKISTEIEKRQISKGIVLRTRKKQYAMLMRQKYREKANVFVVNQNLN